MKSDAPTAEKARSGAQTVDRALSLLRLVAAAPADGLRLADLAQAGGFDRATAHRLLSSLVGHGFVVQDAASKRYGLGLEFFTLAAAASNRYDLAEVARSQLSQLSGQTGDTATFCVRSGLHLVCLDVQTGSYPIKALPMDIGSRRPLGAGAPGIALLAGLPDFEVDQVLAKSERRLADAPGQGVEQIRAQIARCRSQGFALAEEESVGRIMGLSVALINRRNRALGTLTLNGIPERFAPERIAEMAGLVIASARAIDEAMWRMPDGDRHRSRWADQASPAMRAGRSGPAKP
jgi:DNA-binding IclR family transcriptional regulator